MPLPACRPLAKLLRCRHERCALILHRLRPQGGGRSRSGPGLHVVATPIGNLGDISFRALATLAAADLVVAEDTRVTKTLLAHYGITTPLFAYHEHNADAVRPQLHRPARGGPGAGAGLRRRHAARVRPRLPPRRRGPGSRCCRDVGARTFRGAGRAGGGRPADQPLLLRGLPAAQERRAAAAHRRHRRRARHAGDLRIVAPSHRDDGRPRRGARSRAMPRSRAS